ncbi:MAG TPA: alpha/beta fold hydrolase [Candidatus Acidoferrum sp.]
MRGGKGLQTACGIGLLALGAFLVFWPARRYAERRYTVEAGGCSLDLDVVRLKKPATPDSGSIVLLHGLAANRIIMGYLARSFAERGLTVFVPDMPGHGRAPGPFSAERAESCSAALVRGLAARGMIQPERTVLAGHSMGGAIALRIAGKFRPAGVIAISPAPMKAAHGVTPENLLFQGVPPVPDNTLILAGQFEPRGLVANAEDLAAGSTDGRVQFEGFPGNTHVSVLFSPAVARASQEWAASVLHLSGTAPLASRAPLVATALGVMGILLLAGPFVREAVQGVAEGEQMPKRLPSRWRVLAEFAAVSGAVVVVLRWWQPLGLVHLYEGAYLASFFFLSGLALLAVHGKLAREQFLTKPGPLAGAAFAGVVLHLLVTGWVELSASAAWMTVARWLRFPVFFMATFAFLYALEILLGPAGIGKRLAFAYLVLAVVWSILMAGVFHFHSGQILLVLLAPYFALFFALSQLGVQLVRKRTGSAAAAAVFGAILLAGFCLVLFPVS